MTTALEGSEWSAARPGHTLPPRKTRYTLYRMLGGLNGRKISPDPDSIPGPSSSLSVAIPTELPGPHLHFVPRLRMNGVIPVVPPVCHHGVYRDDFTFYYVLPILVNSRPALWMLSHKQFLMLLSKVVCLPYETSRKMVNWSTWFCFLWQFCRQQFCCFAPWYSSNRIDTFPQLTFRHHASSV